MALVGSWDRPLCIQCGRDEGEEGGGRYGHGDDMDKFFCGRCWKSWDETDRRKMMGAYAPMRSLQDPGCPDPMMFQAEDPLQDDPWDDEDDPASFDEVGEGE